MTHPRPLAPSRPIAAPDMAEILAGRRMRRNRRTEWSRRMVRENALSIDDLIWPLFLVEGKGVTQPVESMPGVERYSVDKAVAAAERAATLGIPAIALFPYTDPALRDETGSEALNPENLVCTACRAINRLSVGYVGISTLCRSTTRNRLSANGSSRASFAP